MQMVKRDKQGKSEVKQFLSMEQAGRSRRPENDSREQAEKTEDKQIAGHAKHFQVGNWLWS